MFTPRMSIILRELISMQSISTVTSEHLANLNRVSSRTIRNDIKELDNLLSEHGATVRSVRGTGYELKINDERSFHNFLQDISRDLQQGVIPTLPEDRVQYLIKRLLLTDVYMKLENLADELYISTSTIQNDLRDVKKILNKYEIILDKRPNYGLKVKGDEMKLRFCMSEYIFNRREIELDLLNDRVSILPREEILAIRSQILKIIQEYKINLSDIGLNNLIIHIAIACKRIYSQNHVSLYPEDLKDIIEQMEYEVAIEIVKGIEETFQMVFPEVETAYVAIHLLGLKMNSDISTSAKEVQNFIDQEIYDLTTSILESIENELRLGIKDDKELFIGMSLHLKPAINRYRYGMNLRNPMLHEIKSNYPLAFEAAIVAGRILKQKLGTDMHENEIGYIALHIGGAIERRKMINQPKRCIIVCASGVGSARLLYYKLQSKFGFDLNIIGTTEYYKLSHISMDGLDFIVSTIPIPDNLPIPVIEVNTILGTTDFEKIENIMLEKKHKTIKYTREELVFLQQNLETKEKVIHFLGDKLQKLGLVNEEFIASVFEREAISPTCFGNLVAVPHPIMPQTDTTFWTVCTLQKPITWEDKRVQFVCLLSVQKNSNEDLQKMYNLLGKVIDDTHIVQRLLKCRTYQEFIGVFLRHK
ncbi:transcription antiterminator [Bacillus sp. ISL-4]|uniref:BglG family transcription antiterminator n=1 Tax=Bacillus sp. ISL-4 TaxID=2819125 RepID=UPI001BE68750|nr:BglG family transcription antiterminator [Bacillus sp. ISL-4]MBT2668982.1 transcription antiterminator [Bacillus sp. ISL-4]MBT2675052.1 transcription antiterminator [Streptomyces sp. ISL-14]